jgi:hypothetical protein
MSDDTLLIGDWIEVDQIIYVWDGVQWVDNSIIYIVQDNE